MENEERFKQIEDAILMMKDLIVDHDERLDNYYKAMETSREDFEFKLNALIDSQIQNQIGIGQQKKASQSNTQRIKKLENN